MNYSGDIWEELPQPITFAKSIIANSIFFEDGKI